MSRPELHVIVTASAETDKATRWENMIIDLTKALVDNGLADEPGGGLGGTWSYATNYSNDTFILHRFCWCEHENCPYCNGCDCPEEAYYYTVDGKQCSFDEWLKFFRDNVPSADEVLPEEREAITDSIYKRRGSGKHQHLLCDYCKGLRYVEYGYTNDWDYGVPLFWYKPSGVRMSWYKWLGRGTQVYIPEGVNITHYAVLKDCLASAGL